MVIYVYFRVPCLYCNSNIAWVVEVQGHGIKITSLSKLQLVSPTTASTTNETVYPGIYYNFTAYTPPTPAYLKKLSVNSVGSWFKHIALQN